MNKTTNQAKIIAKIKKCLALSTSSNVNEASIALEQAHKLMQQYGISAQDVEASAATENYHTATVKDSPSEWENALAVSAAKAMNCACGFQGSARPSGRGRWLFIGIEPGPELAAYAFDVLLRQLKRDRAHHVKTQLKRCQAKTKAARAVSYCEGWVYAVYSKITALKPNATTQTAIDAYIAKHYPDKKPLTTRDNPKTHTRNQTHDAALGYMAGQDAQLNQAMTGSAEQQQLEVLV